MATIIGFVLVVWIYSLYDNRKRRSCKHGVLDGKKQIDGICKCSICEAERQASIRQKQEYELSQASFKKYHDMKNRAWERYKARLPYRESSIDRMTGFKFEDYCAKLLKRMGYNVVQTKKTGDGGKDAYAWKDGKKYLVECKHYQGDKKIDRPKLQKLFAAMNEEEADGGIFMATCYYSKEALEYGNKYRIQTINRDQLLELAGDNLVKEDTDTIYSLCCPVCGEIVEFDFFGDKMFKQCSKGHEVPSMFSKKKIYCYNPYVMY